MQTRWRQKRSFKNKASLYWLIAEEKHGTRETKEAMNTVLTEGCDTQ